jgi:DNA-directed RNA polymerase I subunit RPA12
MDPPTEVNVQCSNCSFACPFLELGVGEVTTKSAVTAVPKWVSIADEEGAALDKHAIIEEPCPKCDNPEMYFYTMQLRSVDEGQTVFYECPACNHKFSVNN